MNPHTWCNTGRRRTAWTGRRQGKVTVYECRVCETQIEVPDHELAIEAAASKGIEADCDIVVVREVMA